ncbi:MAG: hypothetical protein ACE5JO_03485, partial [Candidatus Binatia bacterium]
MNSKGTIRTSYFSDFMGLWLLVAMVLWFSHEMVWGGKVPFFRDLGPYFYPIRFSLAESFKAGELPLWDRHMGMGFPLLADFQSGAIYPPHLLFLILPFFTAIRAAFLFHYLVAAIGCYLLCRQWKYPPYLAIIGAILFTLGGTIVSLTNLLNHFQTAVWLPWVIFLWERSLRSGSWKDFLSLTLVLWLQFLAGSPELYAMAMVLLFLDGLRIQPQGGRITSRRIFVFLVGANALAAGLAMIQVLPTVELLLESRGQFRIPYGEATSWSLHPSSLINLFFLDKEVDTRTGYGMRLFFIRDIPFMISHYMGAISLVGVSLWLFYGSRKEKIVLLGLIIISLVMAMGKYTPIYNFFFQYIPLFSLLRFPEKFFFLTYAFLLFVALRGVFLFFQSDDSSSRAPFLIVSSICVLLFLSYLFFRFERETLARLLAWATGTPPLSPSTLKSSSALLVHLERQIVLTLGILFLFFFGKKGRLRPPVFKTLLISLVFIDLNSVHQLYQFPLNPDPIYKSRKIIEFPDPEPHRLFYYAGDFNLHPSHYFILR